MKPSAVPGLLMIPTLFFPEREGHLLHIDPAVHDLVCLTNSNCYPLLLFLNHLQNQLLFLLRALQNHSIQLVK